MRVALQLACERCSAWPWKKTASPGSSTAGRFATGVARRDRGEAVPGVVGVVGAADRLDAGEVAVAAVARGQVGVGVDGLVVAAGGDPQAAVLGVGAVERDPCSDQRVGLGDDVEGVLMPALAGAARALDEEHRLQGEDVGPDEARDDVHDPRVPQVALVDLEAPVEHVNAQQMVEARLPCLVVVAEARGARDGDAPGEQVVDVVEQFLHLVAGEQPANDEVALLAEAHVLLDGDRPRGVVHAWDRRCRLR